VSDALGVSHLLSVRARLKAGIRCISAGLREFEQTRVVAVEDNWTAEAASESIRQWQLAAGKIQTD
jgi:hypothetical protein